MEIIWFMIGFFIFITVIFFAVALFLPEWVGITGKKAHEIMADHQEKTQHPEHEKEEDPRQQ